MKHPDFPFASSYADRHGKTRWRYRKGKMSISLKGEPPSSEFIASYEDAVSGRKHIPAQIFDMPGKARPRSFGAAWKIFTQSAEWQNYADATRKRNRQLAEEFLLKPVGSDPAFTWRCAPVEDLKRRHIKALLAEWAATPHKAKHLIGIIRKMIIVALDEEWIETDPSHHIKWSPKYKGWRAWTHDEVNAYLRYWKPGTTAHLVFCLAFWLGNRRSDIVSLRWDQRVTTTVNIDGQDRIVTGYAIVQGKTGKKLFVPESPMLARTVATLDRSGEMILQTVHGRPFSEKSLTGEMAGWTAKAGLPKGCTIHGLRKTLGKVLVENGASTRQSMDVLGHDDIKHAELYSRGADQIRLAVQAMDRISHLYETG